ncbi:MAG: Signal peptidase I [Berkelbacteria bacterium GW2011_GWA2_38_9]|uniref:Signal peptidase I n=1 Tax=Berkelbacteria bacterium GW2011_GWA2_38_9 TaxID=1618334 RepID=A0A0G0L881_9BACT|nr:MAG: Signal peptidase I [Berkelbacteria bacterium GW2011_GWA2_38_9]
MLNQQKTQSQGSEEEVRFVSPYQPKAQNAPAVQDAGTVVNSFFSVLFEIIKTVVVVGVLALLLRVYIIQPFIVEGLSMSSTLANNDYLLVDKLSYRFGEPQRGDIIVFKYPKDERFNYIKRIIGLPGETIRITQNNVVITNKQNPDGLILHENYIKDIGGSLLNGDRRVIAVDIPQGQYFVMGDNRQGSSDSREWGFLPQKEIIGRSLVRLFPVGDFKILRDPTY